MRASWLTLVVVLLSGYAGTAAAQRVSAAGDWGAMADEVRQRPELAERLKAMLASARRVAATPIVKRVYHYADIGKDRTWLDGRAKFMDGQPRQEWFGLAMSDCGTSGTILTELPLLAFAYRCTGEDVFRVRIISQLEETATWSPLQRPGWQLCTPAPDPVPADYWDGSWLGTGTGIRALADTLELLPAGGVPPELMDKLRTLLARDQDDQRGLEAQTRLVSRRQGSAADQSMGAAHRGADPRLPGVGQGPVCGRVRTRRGQSAPALDVQGQQGEFNEGIGYAMFTVSSMLAAAHAMAAQGDTRALEHPFLRGFPTWAVHHLQPGRFRVNCFDAGGARTPRNDSGTRQLLETLAVFARSQTAAWALSNLYDGPTNDLAGLLAGSAALPHVGESLRDSQPVSERPAYVPPCFAFYDGPARRVNCAAVGPTTPTACGSAAATRWTATTTSIAAT